MFARSLLALGLLCAWSACSDELPEDPAESPDPEAPGETREAEAPAAGTARAAPATAAAAAPPRTLAAGEAGIVHLPVEGVGRVAVRIEAPEAARYPEGAPVVVVVPPFFTPAEGFARSDAPQVGFVSLTLLWPGRSDRRSGTESEGTEDHGGVDSRKALAAVAAYGAGALRDVDGASLGERLELPVLGENLGLYAFSHPGMAAVRTLAEHGASLGEAVDWLVGHENPTTDALSAVELGHWGSDKRPVENPHYRGLRDGLPSVDYGEVRWVVDAQSPRGTPVIGSGAGAYRLGERVPEFFGKRTYSVALTQALLEGGALTRETWPADLSTPEEAAALWPSRVSHGAWTALGKAAPQLRVILVFSERGHVQPSPDLPAIRDAYEGFHEEAGLWTRLNPDAAYVAALAPQRPLPTREHPANTEPSSWAAAARSWGHPARGGAVARTFHALAAMEELADRTRAGDASPDLDAVLHTGPRPSPPAPGERGRRGGGAEATVLTGSTSSGTVGGTGSGTGPQALAPGGDRELLVAFAANLEGGACHKGETSGCELWLANYDLGRHAVTRAARVAREAGAAADFPALSADGMALLYQRSGGGPPAIVAVHPETGATHTLVDKARHPVLDASGRLLAYNTEARTGRGSPMQFDLVRRAVDWSSFPPSLGPAEVLTSDGRSTEPLLLPSGEVAFYRKGEGKLTGNFEVLDPETGSRTPLGAPAGCAHGSVSPSGATVLCQRGSDLYLREVGSEPWGQLGRRRFPRPEDPDLRACDQVTYGHPEFCGDDRHVLATYSCKVDGELAWARLYLFELGGEAKALFSEQVRALEGAASAQARSGVCTPIRR